MGSNRETEIVIPDLEHISYLTNIQQRLLSHQLKEA